MKETKTWFEHIKYWAVVVGMVVAGAVAGYVIGGMVAEEDAARSEVVATNIVERSEQCNGTGGL